MLQLSDPARLGLNIAGDLLSFIAAILVVVSMLTVNAKQLKSIKKAHDEAGAIVDSLDLGRKLTIAGLVFLVIALAIKVIVLRVF